MNVRRICELLGDTASNFTLVGHDELSSTNDELRRMASEGAGAGTVVVADRQHGGRGRLGRCWHSPPGLGLYLSVLFRPRGALKRIPRWTLGAAVAACAACRKVSAAPVSIKWPNDLLCHGRKLAGLLAELRSGSDGSGELVIGVGINVHQREVDFDGELAGLATSLHLLGAPAGLDREMLAAAFLSGMARVAGQLEAGEWEAVAAEWEAMAPGAYDREIRVAGGKGQEPFRGVTRGLDGDGALRVRSEDGRLRIVRAVDSILPLES